MYIRHYTCLYTYCNIPIRCQTSTMSRYTPHSQEPNERVHLIRVVRSCVASTKFAGQVKRTRIRNILSSWSPACRADMHTQLDDTLISQGGVIAVWRQAGKRLGGLSIVRLYLIGHCSVLKTHRLSKKPPAYKKVHLDTLQEFVHVGFAV